MAMVYFYSNGKELKTDLGSKTWSFSGSGVVNQGGEFQYDRGNLIRTEVGTMDRNIDITIEDFPGLDKVDVKVWAPGEYGEDGSTEWFTIRALSEGELLACDYPGKLKDAPRG